MAVLCQSIPRKMVSPESPAQAQPGKNAFSSPAFSIDVNSYLFSSFCYPRPRGSRQKAP